MVADAVARFHRLRGHEVFLLTGTDEHGRNVEETAERAGISPGELADRNAGHYKQAWERLGISHDRFVRTTEPAHRRAVLALWERLERAGELYRGVYEGHYCSPCEAYYEARDLEDDRCPVHGRACRWEREENTFFRLSRHAPALRRLIAETDFVQPATRRAELLGLLGRGLQDLSLTRRNTRWGIPAPGLPGEVLYVFGVDALTNYLTGLGFPDETPQRARLWPTATHVIGKEILRFHGLYWPALLLAAGLPLPRRLVVHGWFTANGEKISKSAGNAIDPLLLADALGVDALRYGLLRSLPSGRDGDFSVSRVAQLYDTELAGGLGNLAQRVVALLHRYRGGRVPEPASEGEDERRLHAALAAERGALEEAVASFALDRALEHGGRVVAHANRYLDRTEPWHLAREGRERDFDRAVRASLDAARLATWLLAPFAVQGCAELAGRLGVPLDGRSFELGRLEAGREVVRGAPAFPARETREGRLT